MNKLVNKIVQLARDAFISFKTDSLFRNAVFLMSSTAIMSALGFGFWFFLAHLYSPKAIGAASALIAITLLISNLSFFGLNSGLLRFLPTSKTKSQDINASLLTVAAASVLGTIAYLFWVQDDLAQSLSLFNTTMGGRLLFVLLITVISLNTFTDSVFIANRRAELHTIVYAVFGVVKLVLPLFLISLGSLGIFMAYVAAAFASLLLSLFLMARYCDYRMFSRPNWGFLKSSGRYSSHNYIAVLAAGLPSQLMPSFIVHGLGEANAAYFSMAWTMANLLYVIPSAISNSLMAESSHDVSRQAVNVRHAVRILTATLVPAVIVAVSVAPYLLKLFGVQYSSGGTVVFQLLALSTFAIAGNSIGNNIMNIERRSGGIIIVQGAIAVVTIGLAWPLMHYGLAGIGLSFLIGNVVGNIAQIALLSTRRRKKSEKANATVQLGQVPSKLVMREFLAHYGMDSAELGCEVGNGDRSGTCIVTTPQGKYVLKVYSDSKRTSKQLMEELNFMNVLGEKNVPVPQIVRAAADTEVVELTFAGASWVGVLMEYETGVHPTLLSDKLVADMARTQGLIHEVGQTYSPASGGVKSDTGSLRGSLIGFTPKGVSHFDYDHTNILTKDDVISCVLDFEGMRYDPLVVCIFYTLTALYSAFPDVNKLKLYLKSYQEVRSLSWIEKRVIRTGLALRFHNPRMLLLHF